MNVRSPLTLFGIALVAVVLVYAVYGAFSSPGPATTPVPTVFFVNGKSFAITYTATNPAERQAGLMNREVTNTTIMLFIFPSPGIYKFWMYDTNTSLDMVWVDSSGQVVYVYANAQPCYSLLTCPTFGPTSQANYVIEAKAGFAQSSGIHINTAIQFKAFAPVQVS